MKKLAVITVALALTACGSNPMGGVGALSGAAGAAGVPGVPGAGASKSVNAGPLVSQLNEVLFNLQSSQVHIFNAFDMKKEAAQAQADANESQKGNSLNAEAQNRTNQAAVQIDTLLGNKGKLTAKAKKEITAAMPLYATAVTRSAGLGVELAAAAQTISTNPMSVAAGPFSAVDLITIFTKSPDLLQKIVTQGHTLITYADENKISSLVSEDGKNVGKGKRK